MAPTSKLASAAMAIDENRLSFSSNGSGVTLHTKFGNLNFNTNEYSYYEALFKIADHHNDGALFIGSSSMVTLLMRTEISWKAIIQAVQIVLDALQSPSVTPQHHSPPISFATAVKSKNGKKNSNNKLLGGNPNPIENYTNFTIKFHHWLLLCKLLAYHKLKREPLDICFQNVPSSEAELRFRLTKIMFRSLEGDIFKQFEIEVNGYKLHGEDYQHQHVKYMIRTISQLVNRTNIVVMSTSTSVSSTSETVTVERRYSEFESLTHILSTHYKGLIIPPLPLKDSRYITPQEVIAARRQHELSLFLHDLNSHPQLKYSFALAVFLESSTNGLRSFFDLYSHMTNGKLEYTQSKHDSDTVTKLFTDGAAMLHTGVNVLSAHTKSFDFVNSWWNTVSKSVAKITSPFTTATYQHDNFETQSQFFDSVEKCSKAMENMLTAEMGRMEECGKLAECFKNVSCVFSCCCGYNLTF